MSAPPLRVQDIRICGYRGFPHAIEIPLKGRSLVLYGENGSGKSSVGKAVRDLLFIGPNAPQFDDHRYRFADPRDDREVTLTLSDAGKAPLTWKSTGRSTTHPDFTDMARARGWLDYRAVWRATEVPSWADYVQVFDTLVSELVSGCESALLKETFGEAWVKISTVAATKPTRGKGARVQATLDRLHADIKTFNTALEAFLPDLEARANRYIADFVPWTTLSLKWKHGASYRPSAHGSKFSHGSIELRMHYRDKSVLRTHRGRNG